MQFDQQLIDHPAVKRTDHMGKGAMEGAFAVGNCESGAHEDGPSECSDHSAAEPSS